MSTGSVQDQYRIFEPVSNRSRTGLEPRGGVTCESLGCHSARRGLEKAVKKVGAVQLLPQHTPAWLAGSKAIMLPPLSRSAQRYHSMSRGCGSGRISKYPPNELPWKKAQ